jgi:Zn-dependent protease
MDQLTTIQLIAVWTLPIIFAVTVHEIAHGFVASLLGDKTALLLGRLTFNPIKHIDLIGTIIVPILLLMFGGIIFGWAKPVPISMRNFRKPKRDMAIVAAAGPLSNFIMAIMWAGITKIAALLLQHNFSGALAIFYMGQAGITFNCLLFVLNFIPIPPLDGGHVMAGFLPPKFAVQFERIAPYGFFIILILLVAGLLGFVLNPLTNLLLHFIKILFEL